MNRRIRAGEGLGASGMHRLTRLALLLTWSLGTAAAAGAAPAASDGDGVQFFESRVRPVLSEHCYRCHSAGAEKLKGGLRLDSRDGLLKGGENGPAIVPGHPERSRLVEAIRYGNPDLQMPPKTRLTDQQVADLARWVKMGAPWPDASSAVASPTTAPADDLWRRRETHWAWQPVRPQAPPAVRDA